MYFTKKIEEILKEFNTAQVGLTETEAKKRINETQRK